MTLNVEIDLYLHIHTGLCLTPRVTPLTHIMGCPFEFTNASLNNLLDNDDNDDEGWYSDSERVGV